MVNKGWFIADFDSAEESISLTASYLSDGPRDFLSSLNRVVNGEQNVQCSWQEEPGTYRFQFQPLGEAIEMTIHFFEDSFSNRDDASGKVKFIELIPGIELLRGVLRGFDRLLFEISEETYLDMWTYPAPTEELERLRLELKRLPKN
jgi:hypothetical protein